MINTGKILCPITLEIRMLRTKWNCRIVSCFHSFLLFDTSKWFMMKMWLPYSLCSSDINFTIAVIIHVFGGFLHFDLDSCYLALVNVVS